MKYSVEYKNGTFVETLEVDNVVAIKTWKREEGEFGLICRDEDFCEQFTEFLDEEVCDDIYDTFDGSFLVSDIENLMLEYGAE